MMVVNDDGDFFTILKLWPVPALRTQIAPSSNVFLSFFPDFSDFRISYVKRFVFNK